MIPTTSLPKGLVNRYENKLLTPARQAILIYLHEYKFGTTKQINGQLQSGKVVNHTLGDLNRLREMNMVQSFPCHVSQGGRSMLCWLLKREGANAVGLVWGNQYDRPPSDQQILMRDWEIDIEHYTNWAGWELMKPITFSRARPAPDPKKGERTEQAEMLRRAVQDSEYQHIINTQQRDPRSIFLNEMIENYRIGMNATLHVPAKANEYLAYRQFEIADQPNGDKRVFTQAVVLILAAPDASNHFWAKRIEEYKRVATRVPVVGLFATEGPAYASKDYIRKGGLRVTLLERLYKLLESYAAKGVDYMTG